MNREEYNKAIQDLWKTNYNFHEECRLSIDIKEKYITSLEATIKAQEIIIRDKSTMMEAMAQPKTCETCIYYVTRFAPNGDIAYNFCTKEINKASSVFSCIHHKVKP